jgi:hypothetical protein
LIVVVFRCFFVDGRCLSLMNLKNRCLIDDALMRWGELAAPYSKVYKITFFGSGKTLFPSLATSLFSQQSIHTYIHKLFPYFQLAWDI